MSKNSLLEAFQIERKSKNLREIADYDIFSDKDLLDNLRTRIIENLIDKQLPKEDDITEFINEEIDVSTQGIDLTNQQRSHLYHLIDNEINKYGPLTELLEDENISAIMVNSPKEIYIETNNNLIQDKSVSFINDEHIIRTIEKLIEPQGFNISSKCPLVNAHLPHKIYLSATIPPLTKNPLLVIQKDNNNLVTIEDFLRVGSLTPYMASFLATCIKANCNILVCGKNNSGKSTLLNVLANLISSNERTIAILNKKEMQFNNAHTITLNEGSMVEPAVIIKEALQLRPDHLLIEKLSDATSLDILEAMNKGYNGTLLAIDASSPKNALQQIEVLALLNPIKLPRKMITEYILNTIDLIVYIEKLPDKKHKVTSICEIENAKDGDYKLKKIFAFNQKGYTSNNEIDGEYILYDEKTPNIIKKLKKQGINDLDYMFKGPVKIKKD